MNRRHAQFAVGFAVLLAGASFWMARVLPTAHVRALRVARPTTTDATAASRARAAPPASREFPSEFPLFGLPYPAPGTHLLGLGLEDGYRYGNGTSSATPHVAGVAALLRQMRPDAAVADLRHWILDTVDPLPTLAGRCVSGGRLNAYAALRAAQILPTITTQPASQTVAASGSATFRVTAEGRAPLVYQWRRNGADIPGATTASHTLNNVQPADAGIYTVVATDAGGTLESQGAILALTATAKVVGSGSEVGTDIRHPNGNVYDQVLLTGPAATITADACQVTRLSYIDLSGDIVQVEFSGPGALTLTLENATGPAPPAKYNQAVPYMKGHATITLAGVTANSHVSIFTVGTLTAVDQTLIRSGETYDGVADVALLSIVSADGRFGGIRAANAEFSGTRGLTGLNAPGVQIAGPVNLHNISASDTATPVLLTGPVDTGQIGVTGGDLYQPNGREIQVGGVQRIAMIAGATSHNVTQPAQANRGCCVCDGQDVTAQLVQNPGG